MKKKFVVHEALLIHYSAFFRAALQGGFKEAETKSVTLEEDWPFIFEIFVHWMYYERFPSAEHLDDEQLVKQYENSKEEGEVGCQHKSKSEVLIRLYLLGDQYQVPLLRNHVLICLFKHSCSKAAYLFPNYHVCNLSFDKLAAKDPLRRFLVDCACRYKKRMYRHKDTGVENQLEPNMLVEIANRYIYVIHNMNVYDYELSLDDYLV